MAMMRTLLADRFRLAFHTEPKDMAVYVLTVAKGGVKFNESAKSDEQPRLVNTIYRAEKAFLPAPECLDGPVRVHVATWRSRSPCSG